MATSKVETRWPGLQFYWLSVLGRFLLAIALLYYLEAVIKIADDTSTLLPSNAPIFRWGLALFFVLLFSKELLRLLSVVGGLSGQAVDKVSWQAVRKLLRGVQAITLRIVTFPVRTYYQPTVSSIFSALLLHWFTVTFFVWLFDHRYYRDHHELLDVPIGERFIDALWRVFMILLNKSVDYPPLSNSSRFIVALGLLLFFVLCFLYSHAFLESRKRLTLRKLKTKPRNLPVFGHILVTGEIPAIRMLLHQLETYGHYQDILVANREAATAAVVGLRDLEPYVWAIEGNLWEREIRREAAVHRARNLVVAGASFDPIAATRTVTAIEADHPEISTFVDGRQCQRSILENSLQKTSSDSEGFDGLLDWGARQRHFHADLKAVPGLAELLRELVHYSKRPTYPRSFYFLLKSETPLIRWFQETFLNLVPLCLPTDQKDDWHRLCIEGDPLPRSSLERLRNSRKMTVPSSGAFDVQVQAAVEFQSVYLYPGRDDVPKCPDCREEHRLLRSDVPNGDMPDEHDKRQLIDLIKKASAGELNGKIQDADNKLLMKLCQEKIWSKAKDGRVLVEFCERDAVDSFMRICENELRRDGQIEYLGNIEAYSDIEIRTLCLALMLIYGKAVYCFIEALWPANGNRRKLEFSKRESSSDDLGGDNQLQFAKVLRRLKEKHSESLIAYRPRVEPEDTANIADGYGWIPCAFGHCIRRGDEILVIKRNNE